MLGTGGPTSTAVVLVRLEVHAGIFALDGARSTRTNTCAARRKTCARIAAAAAVFGIAFDVDALPVTIALTWWALTLAIDAGKTIRACIVTAAAMALVTLEQHTEGAGIGESALLLTWRAGTHPATAALASVTSHLTLAAVRRVALQLDTCAITEGGPRGARTYTSLAKHPRGAGFATETTVLFVDLGIYTFSSTALEAAHTITRRADTADTSLVAVAELTTAAAVARVALDIDALATTERLARATGTLPTLTAQRRPALDATFATVLVVVLELNTHAQTLRLSGWTNALPVLAHQALCTLSSTVSAVVFVGLGVDALPTTCALSIAALISANANNADLACGASIVTLPTMFGAVLCVGAITTTDHQARVTSWRLYTFYTRTIFAILALLASITTLPTVGGAARQHHTTARTSLLFLCAAFETKFAIDTNVPSLATATTGCWRWLASKAHQEPDRPEH